MSNNGNELDRELLSVSSLGPMKAHVSSPREAMYTGNMSQFLVVEGATRRRIKTMMEDRFAETTFRLGFDTDVEIIKVIPRYPRAPGANSIKYNPQTIVIYEDWHTKEVGILDLVDYNCVHQHFGFEYVRNDEIFDSLRPGAMIPRDTVVSKSPLVTEDGDYKYGIETNVAFMSDPSTIEDGIKISESYLKKITPTGFETRVINFGHREYPISLYGGNDEYKIFPDIGEEIHPDGLLFALREYNELLSVVDMTPDALKACDYIYDTKIYGEPNAVIVDIRVERNTNLAFSPTPIGMEGQLMKYYQADTRFYTSILDEYLALQKKRGKRLKISEEFQRLVVQAIARVGKEYFQKNKGNGFEKLEATKVTKVYRSVPLDDWRVEITYKYKGKPNIGYKLTDTLGGKGVVCSVVPDEDMPIDDNGNRVDLIMDDLSTTRRLNPGRFYEQYINAASRDVVKRMRTGLGFDANDNTRQTWYPFFTDLEKNLPKIEQAWNYLRGYYQIIAPLMLPYIEEVYPTIRDLAEHVYEVVVDDIYLYFPPDNPINRPEAIRQLQEFYPPMITPVTFRGLSGEMVRTVKPVMVGSMYFLVLEKTAEDWSAVSSALLQHWGTTARLTNFNKFSAPGRLQPTKTIGESESRLLAAAAGGEFTADIMDQNNNPVAHKAIQRKILTADYPTNIDKVLDREEVPKGGHRPLNYLKHIFECSGKGFTNS